jgi:surface protein
MSFMFWFANEFNSDLSNWDVSQVTTISYMFANAFVFNGCLSGDHNERNVLSRIHLQQLHPIFNGDLSTWDVLKVTTMKNTFLRAISFNEIILFWDVCQVTDMDWMFAENYYPMTFNRDMSFWDVSKVLTTRRSRSTSAKISFLLFLSEDDDDQIKSKGYP